jgi:hypothetical protein
MNDRIRVGRIWEPVENGRKVYEIVDVDDFTVYLRILTTNTVVTRMYHQVLNGIVRDKRDDEELS